MMEMPSFAAFFEAVHDFPPFPWQRRLADEVLSRGWPDLLDLPTGVGKTTALDVALYALAAAPARMPRRTLLVVDRRIVVDQGAEHAARPRDPVGAS
jgi:CRISPR-associated endonuclease/helicase Cas3